MECGLGWAATLITFSPAAGFMVAGSTFSIAIPLHQLPYTSQG